MSNFQHRRVENEPAAFTAWFEMNKIGSGPRNRAAFLAAYLRGMEDARAEVPVPTPAQTEAEVEPATP